LGESRFAVADFTRLGIAALASCIKTMNVGVSSTAFEIFFKKSVNRLVLKANPRSYDYYLGSSGIFKQVLGKPA